jgi:hypothetical protein
MGAFAVACLPFLATFKLVDERAIVCRYGELHKGDRYSLKPWAEWHSQGARLLFRILPLSIGLGQPVIAFYEERRIYADWKALLSGTGIAVLLLVGVMKKRRSANGKT